MFEDIEFETVEKPCPEELSAFYERQHHTTTRAPEKLRQMVDDTFCFVTARRDGELIGLARGLTDGVQGRLVECKLDPAFQGPACITKTDGRVEHDSSGIASEMARRAIEALLEYGVERIDVLAYGTEVDFCEELGFRKIRGVVAMELTADAYASCARAVTSDAASS